MGEEHTNGADWSRLIPDNEWRVYREILEALQARKIPFMLGGGFAMTAYTGRWRNTKDLDLIVLPKDRDAVIALLTEAGFTDDYDRSAYERYWIYRATRDALIVDVIWGTRNRHAVADESWFENARTVALRGLDACVLSPEMLIWNKVYIIIRNRTDVPDIVNILYGTAQTLDWDRLIRLLGEDLALLSAVMWVFGWLCPGRAQDVPDSVWERLRVPRPEPGPAFMENRVRLLDDRLWFAPSVPPGVQMEI